MAVGRVPLAELMPLLSPESLSNLTFYNVVLNDVQNEPLTFKDMARLGSLMYFLPDEIQVNPEDLKLFVDTLLGLPHHRCVCLPEKFRLKWAALLKESYGYVKYILLLF